MEQKKERLNASPILIGVAALVAIGLCVFLYSRYVYERTITPEETMRMMGGAREKQMRQRMNRAGGQNPATATGAAGQ